MAENHVELAEEFRLPKWSEGFWGSRFFGSTGGLLMDMLAEGVETGIWSTYIYPPATLAPDSVFDQPLDALVQLGSDAGLPWYPEEDHYNSLRIRLRDKWDFWPRRGEDRVIGELAAAGIVATIRTPNDAVGALGIDSNTAGSAHARAHAIAPFTFPPQHDRLKSVSVFVGANHSGQSRLGLYQGSDSLDINEAVLVADLGLTSGSGTEEWLTLPAPANSSIDTTKYLWVVWIKPANFDVKSSSSSSDSTFHSEGRRDLSVFLSTDPADLLPATIDVSGSASTFWYGLSVTTESADEYWSRFWVTLPYGTHPVTGSGALQGDASSIQGVTKQGPAGLTSAYLNLMRSITKRYKAVDWVPWDFRFQLADDSFIVLQGHRRVDDPMYQYREVP